VLIACGDELWQRFTPDRFSDWADVVKDTVGAAVGLGLLWLARDRLARSDPA